MILIELDHIVVAATTLEQGAAYVERVLGVELSEGGKHAFMGTHNKLLHLGNGTYLEVIAIDPSAPAPQHPRWFNLDDPGFQQSLCAAPRLIHWVARTLDIKTATTEIEGADIPIIAASRGALHWKITIPDDGSLPMAGAFPTLIEWPEGPHVSENMSNHGLKLEKLVIRHPKASDFQSRFKRHLNDQRVEFELGVTTALDAVISSPQGMHKLF